MAVANGEFRRLGKKELGPYALEEQMPGDIAKLLQDEDSSNSVAGVVPNLAQLLEHDSDVEKAYLCTDNAVQLSKLPNEGAHFCGYRNMQMLWSVLASMNARLGSAKPTVLKLQALIEDAWDVGINDHGRILTGGIKGTRKHVGTSEAEALFLSLDIPCRGQVFSGKDASTQLLDSVEAYFSDSTSSSQRVNRTNRMPIFLQRPQHSITIVGIQKMRSGKRRLLIFDPAWSPPSKVRSPLSESDCRGWKGQLLLRRYRKSQRYFGRFKEFETLEIEQRGPDS
ncbi:hypothetical protein M409DRAFT_66449 [Zasmidium cellare ATCC 36951]|uniref:UFSP1/2/DUB catalytic domain-containing protein n=1 Tax=Zasmidium cellare ATCC 36951 TaxID=1080233 RepID=A0A6A6CMF9_ZASCE|nr:uncharacterized protein M409DRAFT_66449 [Zasmidium cellare ATCC 36951]KAF2166929.1 hypothetical protein M409DRAFT_66449 [Zasmidium cellare ATCC 36951]